MGRINFKRESDEKSVSTLNRQFRMLTRLYTPSHAFSEEWRTISATGVL